jgi:5-methylcytosine-specific restriction protein A
MPTAPRPPCLVSTCPERRPCPIHARTLAREPDKRSYHLARWRNEDYGLRWQCLRRDPLCVECRKAGRVEAATQVDHVIPPRGDPGLFWDPDNVQGLCEKHHGEKSRRGE